MAADAEVVVRLVPGLGPDGFWPRENYVAGNGENGYAVAVRAATACTIEPGRVMRLVVPNHVPHLPYRYDGGPLTLGPDHEVALVFEYRGCVTVLTDERKAMHVQHRFDPGGTVEATDAHGHPVVQQGRRGSPIIHRGEVVPS